MVERLQNYLCKHIKEQTQVFKEYLLAALDSKSQYICYLDERLGTLLPSIDIKNCELLADAGLFHEEVKVTRDGRNRYKVFYLTALGKEMAKQIKAEGYANELRRAAPMA